MGYIQQHGADGTSKMEVANELDCTDRTRAEKMLVVDTETEVRFFYGEKFLMIL